MGLVRRRCCATAPAFGEVRIPRGSTLPSSLAYMDLRSGKSAICTRLPPHCDASDRQGMATEPGAGRTKFIGEVGLMIERGCLAVEFSGSSIMVTIFSDGGSWLADSVPTSAAPALLTSKKESGAYSLNKALICSLFVLRSNDSRAMMGTSRTSYGSTMLVVLKLGS